jgi:hypothetical protein
MTEVLAPDIYRVHSNYVHTVTFLSVFICGFTLKRMPTLLIYDRSCSLFNILEIFSFGPCEQGVKTIKGIKTFLNIASVFTGCDKRLSLLEENRFLPDPITF